MAPAVFFLQKSTKKTTFCISLVIYAYTDTYARTRIYNIGRKPTSHGDLVGDRGEEWRWKTAL